MHVQTRFEPRTRLLNEVKPDEFAWATRDDLISVKALAASNRPDEAKSLQDVRDIEVLLSQFPGPLVFPGSAMAEANKAFVKEFIPSLAKFGKFSEKEWLELLGL